MGRCFAALGIVLGACCATTGSVGGVDAGRDADALAEIRNDPGDPRMDEPIETPADPAEDPIVEPPNDPAADEVSDPPGDPITEPDAISEAGVCPDGRPPCNGSCCAATSECCLFRIPPSCYDRRCLACCMPAP